MKYHQTDRCVCRRELNEFIYGIKFSVRQYDLEWNLLSIILFIMLFIIFLLKTDIIISYKYISVLNYFLTKHFNYVVPFNTIHHIQTNKKKQNDVCSQNILYEKEKKNVKVLVSTYLMHFTKFIISFKLLLLFLLYLTRETRLHTSNA